MRRDEQNMTTMYSAADGIQVLLTQSFQSLHITSCTDIVPSKTTMRTTTAIIKYGLEAAAVTRMATKRIPI